MRLESVSQNITNEIRKVDSARRNDKTDKTKSAPKSDSLSFSSNAQRLSETKANADIVASRIEIEPDVRMDKVEEVRKKIENGFYNSEEFTDKLADKLISDFGISNTES